MLWYLFICCFAFTAFSGTRASTTSSATSTITTTTTAATATFKSDGAKNCKGSVDSREGDLANS